MSLVTLQSRWVRLFNGSVVIGRAHACRWGDGLPAHARVWQRGRVTLGLASVMLVLGGVAHSPTTRAGTPALLALPSSDIACQETPFGRRLTLGADAEMVELLAFGSNRDASLFREWNLSADPSPEAPPLAADITEYWRYYHGAQGTLLKAVRTDLDGDGRDEVVIAMDVTGDGPEYLTLGVFRRQPYNGKDIDLFSTWTLNLPFAGFDMVAGDFDGSRDGKQELAVMVRTDAPDRIHVFVLTGAANGGIANLDNSWSGLWTWQPLANDVGIAGIGAGSLLLDGRDQMVVVAESDQITGNGDNRRLNYHLLEYDSSSPGLVVPPGSWRIASKSFDMLVGSNFEPPNGGRDITRINRIEVHAGDVAGKAKAELVVDIGFESPGSNNSYFDVIQFLHHFRIERDAERRITGVQLATRPNGDRFDSNQLVSQGQYVEGDWDVVVANIDDHPKQEIVIVRNDAENHDLQVDVYKASPQLTASFRYFRTDHTVQFHSDSVGFPQAGPFDPGSPHRWDFGDGQTSDKVNPNHTFENGGLHTVTLRLKQTIDTADGTVTYHDSYSQDIVIDDGNSHGGGEDPDNYMYQVLSRPYYQAHYHSEIGLHFGPIRVAVGDMDRDGRIEIMTLARKGTDSSAGEGMLRSLWQIDYPEDDQDPPAFLHGTHMLQQAGAAVPIADLSGMALIADDFDGDAVEATIAADCRAVTESKIHQVIWAPPYFERLQANADRTVSFGQSTTNGDATQSHFGAYTGTAISGYMGVEAGVELFGILGGSASARVTAGRYHQAATGTLKGQEKSFALAQGYTQQGHDGLVTLETNTFYCYTYDVSQASLGLVPASSLRVCEIHDPDDLTYYGPSSPGYWNREFPKTWAAATGGYAPPNWVPLTRDWASVSLFEPVTSNAALTTNADPPVAVAPGQAVTDGLFTTHVESQARYQPYVQIDLGSVRPITTIRVFSGDGDSTQPGRQPTSDMTGFRVYTSTRPMPESGLPSGPQVHMFQPDSLGGIVRGRWNIWARVGNPGNSDGQLGDPIRARYIRLQNPGQARLNVAEIQVFGDVHQDPPRYPEAVCDPHTHDGRFKAKIWDSSVQQFRAIQVHGDILWLGTGPASGNSWGSDGPFLKGCHNDAALMDANHNFAIWKNKSIGSSGGLDWSFTTTTGATTGETRSFESSTSVGAEFETTLSAGASFVAGGSEEFSSGVTRDYQSTTFWSADVDMGGSIGGFQPPYDTNRYVSACHYNVRPYAYALVDRSSTGYAHTMYVVDYVVPQGIGATAWTRGDLPSECRSVGQAGDLIFRNGFEGR